MTVSAPRHEASQARSRSLFLALAASALGSTLLLILVGGIVRVTGHGLGCPDWPLCYGRAIPPGFTGAWVEFTHRLVGASASVQIVLLAILAWRRHRDEKWIYRPALAALALLAMQIPLGGMHVIMEIPPETGLIHTSLAMLIVGLIAVVATAVLPAGERLKETAARHWVRGGLFNAISIAAAATYLLLLTGSYVTRSGASLACPSFPWCGASSQALRPLMDIQMLHRYVAFAVAGLTLGIIAWILRRTENRSLRRFVYGIAALLLLQFALGVANVLLRLPMWSRALHLTVGATLWIALVVLWTAAARARRLSLLDTEPASA